MLKVSVDYFSFVRNSNINLTKFCKVEVICENTVPRAEDVLVALLCRNSRTGRSYLYKIISFFPGGINTRTIFVSD